MSGRVYTHDLSPWLVQVQFFGTTVGLRWYGLAYLLGFGLAWWSVRQAERNGRTPGLTSAAAEHLLIGVVLGVLLGRGATRWDGRPRSELLRSPIMSSGDLACVRRAMTSVAQRR